MQTLYKYRNSAMVQKDKNEKHETQLVQEKQKRLRWVGDTEHMGFPIQTVEERTNN